MFLDYKLEGAFANLRSVVEEDASFILKLRNDPEISKFLPRLNVTEEQQQQWIQKQRKDRDSYYFIIEDKACNCLGTISIYDIVGERAETGRYASFGEPVQNIEASVLMEDFFFYDLKLKEEIVWVYEDNKHVLSLDIKNGSRIVSEGEDDNGKYYKMSKDVSLYNQAIIKHKRLLRRLANNEFLYY